MILKNKKILTKLQIDNTLFSKLDVVNRTIYNLLDEMVIAAAKVNLMNTPDEVIIEISWVYDESSKETKE
jgi:hypothetical protein